MRVAFQGEPGAYSEAAAMKLYPGAETLPCRSFVEVFGAVKNGQATHGILPVENSVAGTVQQNWDLLHRQGLLIVGEVELLVEHCLLANPGTTLADLRHVHSHPQALAQCDNYLRALPNVEIVSTYDTAGSAKGIRDKQLMDAGAIASKRAAEIFGLTILASNVQDYPDNITRFVIVSTEPATGDTDKTTVIFALKSVPGALWTALGILKEQSIDLTKLESHPVRGEPWAYMFYTDMSVGREDERCRRALEQLNTHARWVKFLGSYKSWKDPVNGTSKTGV